MSRQSRTMLDERDGGGHPPRRHRPHERKRTAWLKQRLWKDRIVHPRLDDEDADYYMIERGRRSPHLSDEPGDDE